VEAQPTAVAETDRASVAASQTSDLMQRFRPGQSLDAEIEAYERQQDEARAASEALAAAAALDRLDATGVESATLAEATEAPEPAVAAPEAAVTAPEAAVTAPEPALEAPAPEPTPEPAPRVDLVEQPTWRIVAPDPESVEPAVPTTEAPAVPAVPPVAAQAEPQWPASPEWPSQRQAAGLPFLNRPAQPTGGIDALWAASASEVTHRSASASAREVGGVQPCVSCGLSLSATARFCRRCGTRQG
jgi:hypothetical protein